MSYRSSFIPKRVPVSLLPSMVFLGGIFLLPALGLADVEGSLRNVKSQLTGTILPVLSVIGLGISSLSFFTGNPQAKQHIVYAILGCCFGFGAQAISDFISTVVH